MRRTAPLLAALVVAVGAAAPAVGAGRLTVRFVSVGQGDSTIFEGPCGQFGVLDAPRGTWREVLQTLEEIGAPKVEWITVSHYDSDHLGGVIPLAKALAKKKVEVPDFYDRGELGGTPSPKSIYGLYVKWLTDHHRRRHRVDIDDRFWLCRGDGKVKFKVVSVGTDGTAAGGVAVHSENDKGICLKITFRRWSAASCGDINGVTKGKARTDVETPVAPKIGPVQLVKVDHHGSRFSSNQTFVDTLHPRLAVISVGKNNWGHPDDDVIARWEKVGSDVLLTGTSTGHEDAGDVIVTTDGKTSMQVHTTNSGFLPSYSLARAAKPQWDETASASLRDDDDDDDLLHDLGLIGGTAAAVAVGGFIAGFSRRRPKPAASTTGTAESESRPAPEPTPAEPAERMYPVFALIDAYRADTPPSQALVDEARASLLRIATQRPEHAETVRRLRDRLSRPLDEKDLERVENMAWDLLKALPARRRRLRGSR